MAGFQHRALQRPLERQRVQKESETFQKIWKPILSTTFTCAIIYFLYHSISGDHGIIQLIQLNNEINRTQEALQLARAERTTLENNVMMMREDTINMDMLDEQVRRVLGYVGKDETVYIVGGK